MQLEEELEEEQASAELAVDKMRKAQMQVEQFTTDLSAERLLTQKLDGEKQTLERHNRDLKVVLTMGICIQYFRNPSSGWFTLCLWWTNS